MRQRLLPSKLKQKWPFLGGCEASLYIHVGTIMNLVQQTCRLSTRHKLSIFISRRCYLNAVANHFSSLYIAIFELRKLWVATGFTLVKFKRSNYVIRVTTLAVHIDAVVTRVKRQSVVNLALMIFTTYIYSAPRE